MDDQRTLRAAAPALSAVVVCLIGLIVTGVLALVYPAGRAHDAVTLAGFTDLSGPGLDRLAALVAHLVDLGPFVAITSVLTIVALRRGQPRLALVAIAAMAGSAGTAELLKPLLAGVAPSSGPHAVGSWPSGHATAAMSVALGGVLVAPRRLRPLAAAAGTALAVAVSYSILVLAWHMPSDILGGFFLAAAWTGLAVAGQRAADERWPKRSGREAVARAGARAGGMLAPILLLVGAAGVAVLGLVARPGPLTSYGAEHKTFLVGALVIAGLAWVLSTGLAAALRR